MGDYVFICYARDDQAFVIELASNLEKRGIKVWLDQWHIQIGADWDMEIDKALLGCSKFMIVLSPASVRSNEVRGEVRTAIDERKPIVPVLYKACQVPRQLKLFQYIDLTSCNFDDESLLISLEIALSKRGMEAQIPIVKQFSKEFADPSTGSPLYELAKIVDEWIKESYPGYMVEGLAEKQIAFIRHPPNKLNISNPALLLFLMRAGLHYGGNWPFWITKCEGLSMLTGLLVDSVCQSYDRVKFRALYALQYHNLDELKHILEKKKKSIPNNILSIVDKYVYCRTVLDYLKEIASSSDKRLSSKASAVIREIAQFGFIMQN